MKLRHANYHDRNSARSTCHVSRERAVLDLIALRQYDTAIIYDLWKKSISNLHVKGMPLDEQTVLIQWHAVLPITGLWSPSVSKRDR